MSTSKIALLSLLMAGLTACGGPNKSVGPGGTPAPTIVSAITDLRGTPNENLSANHSIVRLHAAEDDQEYRLADANAVTVNDNGETLTIVGMPFDGQDDNYVRLVNANNLDGTAGKDGDFYIYKNRDDTAPDSYGGRDISQFGYLAIHRSSDDGKAFVTIVASTMHNENGINVDGFVYGRNGGFTRPVENQGSWGGDYAAIRTFDDENRLQYVSATMELDIDFEKLESAGALKMRIVDRNLYSSDGTFISQLPSFGGFFDNFALDFQGEFQGGGTIGEVPAAIYDEDLGEWVPDGTNTISSGTGTIQGMLAGDFAETIVGTFTLAGGNEIAGTHFIDDDDDPATPDVIYYSENTETSGTVNETGAFMLDRSR